MQEGVCGNGVVETAAGEDCDRFPSETCVPPGEKHQCRLTCAADDQGTRPDCPTGWGCGLDDLCRQPDGSFSEKETALLEDTPKLIHADVDGDRRAELLSVTSQELVVTFFDGEGFVAETVSRYSLPTAPVAGQLTESGSPQDITLLTSEGMTVLLGSADRELPPTAYAPFALTYQQAKAVIMEAMPHGNKSDTPVNWVGEEIIVVAEGKAEYITRWVDEEIMSMTGNPGSFQGDPLVGKLNPQWPCEEMILNFDSSESVFRYNPCSYDGTNPVGWNHGHEDVAFSVPSGMQVATSASLVDANLDGLLDVMVGVVPVGTPAQEQAAEAVPVVAYGVGNGTFNSSPPPPPPNPPPDPPELPVPGDGKAVPLDVPVTPDHDRTGESNMPLAVADLNDDGALDFVMPDVVIASIEQPGDGYQDDPLYGVLVVNQDEDWDQAVIDDFNANGLLDVMAASSKGTGITFLNGTGTGLFNEFWLPTDGRPAHLTVGDFDGDLVHDLAFAETRVQTDDGRRPGDALSVVFGEGFGAPADPITIGYLDQIEQISAGSMAAFHLDDIDDLVVVTRPGADPEATVSIAALGGSSNRQLLSPFVLAHPIGDNKQFEMLPWLATVGEFDGDDTHADLAVLGLGDSMGANDIRDIESRLWLVPCSEEASIDPNRDRPSSPLGKEFLGSQAAMAPIDLDGDGTDEVVMALTFLDEDAGEIYGVWQIGRVQTEGEARWFAMQEAGRAPSLYWQSLGGLSLEAVVADKVGQEDDVESLGTTVGTHMAVGNVVGDEREEIVTLGFFIDPSTGTVSSSVQLLRQDGAGGLDVDGIVDVSQGVPGVVTAFALAHLDDDGYQEIVFVTEQQAYRADIEEGDVTWSELDGAGGGRSVAVADFTGDGVVDIAVGKATGVVMYKGNAVNP